MNRLSEVSADTKFLKLLTAEMGESEQVLLLVTESGGPEQKIKIPAQDFVAGVSGMALDAEAGYSVAPNTFTAEGFGTVAAFHAVVLDVSGANLGAVERQLRSSKRAPNVVVRSGQKLQLWWIVHPLEGSKENALLWQKAAHTLKMRVEQLLGEMSGVTVRACAKTTEGFSLPGSIDPGSDSRVEARVVCEARYNLTDLVLLALPQNQTRLCPASNRRNIPAYRIQDWSESMLWKVEGLRELRKAPIGKEFRNNFCFAYFCLLLNLQISADEVGQRIAEFNQGFNRPLNEHELRRTLTTAWEKKYHLSSERIVALLGITEEEAEKLEIPFPDSISPSERRQLRNHEIVKLRNDGYKHTEIAKIVGVSEKTVQAVAKRMGASTLAERILAFHKSGLSKSEIAKKAKCSERYVREVLNGGKCETGAEQNGSFPYNDLPQAEGPQGGLRPQGEGQIIQPFLPAIELLRAELKKRYAKGMSNSDFDQHFTPMLRAFELAGTPALDDVKAEFTGKLSPEQDEMYRFYLNI